MLAPLLLAAAAVLGSYLIHKIRWWRLDQFKNVPQVKPDGFWGHLKLMGELMSSGRKDAHPDEIFVKMSEELGRPPVFLVDNRPVSWPMILIASHEAAEQITRASKLHPWSVPKSPSVGDIVHVIGSKSLLIKEGEEWKQFRKMFNPGFAPSHILTLLPAILAKLPRFIELLENKAKTGGEFPLAKPIINLTFDIIGAVVIDTDTDAQHEKDEDRGGMIRLFDELSQTYTGAGVNFPWWLRPRLEYRRIGIARKIDRLLAPIVRQKHAELKESKSKGRTVLDLSLQGIDELTDFHVSLACDQIKTFLFAGHDTTAILLSWTFYELSRTPRVLKAVRAELDDLFGPDPDPKAVIAKFMAPGGEELLGRMPYISAVLKESLRLHPPAGSARMSPTGSGMMMRMPNGEDVCIDNMIIYLCARLIQQDPSVYGDTADDFMPERWIGDSDTSQTTNDDSADTKGAKKIPASAWRPFERGPRNCIGQELANIEARVIVAVIARRFDFTKVGLGELDLDEKGKPMLNEKGQYKVKSEVYQTIQVTAKPVDGMMVKVKLA
ncbi:cytochrome P450 [Cercophora newfieldiana]|uniref:Cytochrome P450 n=1 Tax=Cercophora newfieldiana TaxID=92897 RepID=A0AA40CGZ7_9PEZI|nr:cytochrome P450 [Cercophora newfieldiana]